MKLDELESSQKDICQNYGSTFVSSSINSVIGISKNFNLKNFPINGLRHPQQGNSNGWYIWSGTDFSQDPNFFIPLHVEHLEKIAPEVLNYLGLSPGWRFLLGENNYVDVWEDKSLLNIV